MLLVAVATVLFTSRTAAQQAKPPAEPASNFLSSLGWIGNASTSSQDQGIPTTPKGNAGAGAPLDNAQGDPSGGLSLSDTEALALAHHPALAEAAARIAAARGQWLQAGLPPNPEIGYSGQQLGSGGEAEQHGLYLGRKFIRGGKLDLDRAIEAEEIYRQNAVWTRQRQRILTDVRIAFYGVLAAQKRRELAQELVAITSQAKEAATALFNADEGSRVDVVQADIELETVTAAFHQAEFEWTKAWRQLAASVGQPDLPIQPLIGQLEEELEPISFEQAWQVLQQESPELLIGEIEVEKARRVWLRRQAENISDVDAQAVLQYDQSTESINGNLQLTLPLRTANRNQGAIQEAMARWTEAKESLERKRLELRQRLSEAVALWEVALDQVEHYRQAILPKAAENLELVRRGYQAGEFSFVQVLTVQRTYAEKHAVYLEALRESKTRGLEIVGLLLKGGLDDF
jgi:cobalt-zinc-cadmium efflux system outer membrane protein